MKKLVLSLFIIVFLMACAEEVIKKPENLIPEDRMGNILYDLAIYNAIKSSDPSILTENKLGSATDYVFDKYKIDSIQFVKSNQYYASIPLKYQKIHENVEKRLEEAKEATDKAREQRTDSMRKINELLRDSVRRFKKVDSLQDK